MYANKALLINDSCLITMVETSASTTDKILPPNYRSSSKETTRGTDISLHNTTYTTGASPNLTCVYFFHVRRMFNIAYQTRISGKENKSEVSFQTRTLKRTTLHKHTRIQKVENKAAADYIGNYHWWCSFRNNLRI